MTDDRVAEEIKRRYLKEMKTDDLDQLLKLQEKLGFNKRKFQLSKISRKGLGIGAPICSTPTP
jgi:hypothetical protein